MNPSWTSFFATAASTSGALTGLIFVALSVNIRRILEFQHLPSRAAAAMGSLMLILTSSLDALAPQPLRWLGCEALGLTLIAWLLQINSAWQSRSVGARYRRPAHEFVIEVLTSQLQLAPYVVGAALLALGSADGLYWLAAGAVLVFCMAVLNAWVLLVEILR